MNIKNKKMINDVVIIILSYSWIDDVFRVFRNYNLDRNMKFIINSHCPEKFYDLVKYFPNAIFDSISFNHYILNSIKPYLNKFKKIYAFNVNTCFWEKSKNINFLHFINANVKIVVELAFFNNRVSPLAVYTFYFFGNTATHSVYKNFRTSIVTFFQ